MIRFSGKLIDFASVAQVLAVNYGYEVTEVFDLVSEYNSFDLVYDAIQYAHRENIDDLKKACDIIYKSEALKG